MKMDFEREINKFVKTNSEKSLVEFNKKLVTTKYKIHGIRTEKIRKFAKKLVKENCRLNLVKPNSHEEILLRGFMLGNMKLADKETLVELKKFINHIDNWATCDMVVASLKTLTTPYAYEFFEKSLLSPSPITRRIGVVGFMTYHLSKKEEIISLLSNLKEDDYYVRMAVAWLLCTLICQDYFYGVDAIKKFKDKFIINKAISKCCDSYKLTGKQKAELKLLKQTLLKNLD